MSRRPERYSVGIDSAASAASGAVYAAMIAGATKAISIRSIRVTASSNAGGHIALQRASSVGTATAAGTFTGVAHRVASSVAAATAKAANAWSQAPTGYVSHLRDDILQIATGTYKDLWREEDGPLVVEPNSAVILINQGSGIAAGSLHVNFTWEEGPL